ncbi:MAG: S8 family serine peptidase [Bacteroidales bacterium]|nr:S8 family serine peptidase [Bacteroidales bacterium]
MKTKYFFALGAFALFLLSCRQESLSGDIREAAPIVRLSEDIATDAVLVKFGTALSDAEQKAVESSGGVQLQRVFPSMPGKEALEREYGLDRWYEAVLAQGDDVHAKALEISRIGNVQVVEYASLPTKSSDGAVYAALPATKADTAPFNDPLLSNQWHYKNYGNPSFSKNSVAGADVNVTDVWANLTCGDPDIIIAVVDEGVKWSHPDLKDNMWTNTKEIPNNGIDDDGNGYADDVYGFNFAVAGAIEWTAAKNSGHGTHCAGTIAAVNNNGKGVAGIAGGSGKGDGCRIMSCQIFSGDVTANAASTARAIKYAADMGASIISCSFGYTVSFSSDDEYIKRVGSIEIDAIHYFEAPENANNPVLNGNIAIFAAGNENHAYAHYPGGFCDIISVSAFGPDGLPTYYTNYGPGCNIAAPGGEAYHLTNRWESMVLSTVTSEIPQLGTGGASNQTGLDYGYMQGTSMACPHVSGVVALGLSYAKKLGKKFDRDEFKRMILASVNDIDQRISSVSSKTYAYAQAPLTLSPYYHQMGTGAIDAWRLMMHIEGLPTLTSQIGKSQWIDLTSAFGTASVSLTYLKVEVPEATVTSLGLQKIEPTNAGKYPAVVDPSGYAYVQFGRLYVSPTKLGSGKIKISAVGGGDHLGGGSNPPGGMELVQEVSLIARDVPGGNGTGGWL